jgi:hypothetical protein
MPRTYKSVGSPPLKLAPKPQPVAELPPITPETPLVNLREVSRILSETRGLTLSEATLRRYCAEGKWQQG